MWTIPHFLRIWKVLFKPHLSFVSISKCKTTVPPLISRWNEYYHAGECPSKQPIVLEGWHFFHVVAPLTVLTLIIRAQVASTGKRKNHSMRCNIPSKYPLSLKPTVAETNIAFDWSNIRLCCPISGLVAH